MFLPIWTFHIQKTMLILHPIKQPRRSSLYHLFLLGVVLCLSPKPQHLRM